MSSSSSKLTQFPVFPRADEATNSANVQKTLIDSIFSKISGAMVKQYLSWLGVENYANV